MWQRDRFVMAGVLTVVVCGLLMGCQTRQVLTSYTHDMVSEAPDWAKANGQRANDEEMFFVGVSEEQASTEAEAINQAYMDALRRVGDAAGLTITGRDSMGGAFDTQGQSRWPHQASRAPTFRGLGLGGLGAFAISSGDNGIGGGFPVLGVGYFRKRDFERALSGKYESSRGIELLREQVISQVNVVDTWTVAERFQHPNQVNQMKYGELWKAKVLVSVPKKVVKTVAEDQYKMRKDELEFDLKVRRDNCEMQQNELKADFENRQHAAQMRGRDWELWQDEQNKKLDLELELRRQYAERMLDRPTFHFMNNTYWYGHAPLNQVLQMGSYFQPPADQSLFEMKGIDQYPRSAEEMFVRRNPARAY